jgi:hypothetical protein
VTGTILRPVAENRGFRRLRVCGSVAGGEDGDILSYAGLDPEDDRDVLNDMVLVWWTFELAHSLGLPGKSSGVRELCLPSEYDSNPLVGQRTIPCHHPGGAGSCSD